MNYLLVVFSLMNLKKKTEFDYLYFTSGDIAMDKSSFYTLYRYLHS